MAAQSRHHSSCIPCHPNDGASKDRQRSTPPSLSRINASGSPSKPRQTPPTSVALQQTPRRRSSCAAKREAHAGPATPERQPDQPCSPQARRPKPRQAWLVANLPGPQRRGVSHDSGSVLVIKSDVPQQQSQLHQHQEQSNSTLPDATSTHRARSCDHDTGFAESAAGAAPRRRQKWPPVGHVQALGTSRDSVARCLNIESSVVREQHPVMVPVTPRAPMAGHEGCPGSTASTPTLRQRQHPPSPPVPSQPSSLPPTPPTVQRWKRPTVDPGTFRWPQETQSCTKRWGEHTKATWGTTARADTHHIAWHKTSSLVSLHLIDQDLPTDARLSKLVPLGTLRTTAASFEVTRKPDEKPAAPAGRLPPELPRVARPAPAPGGSPAQQGSPASPALPPLAARARSLPPKSGGAAPAREGRARVRPGGDTHALPRRSASRG